MRQTLTYPNRPRVRASAAIAGAKEGAGPLGGDFDQVVQDELLGQDTWEQAESELSRRAIALCLKKGGLTPAALEALLCGDLLNQIIASGFAGRALGAPFLGLYGACSTVVEALVLGGALVDGGYRANCVCAASSHFCTAERQYRFPLELGNQRPPSAQWTATAAGAVLLDARRDKAMARLTHGTLGRVVDYQIADANHMGAAMAPAVQSTITAHFDDTGTTAEDFDLIATGDLGWIGRDILLELFRESGRPMPPEKLVDCGASLFYQEQDAHAGGSGCGCVASVTCGWLMKRMEQGELKRILVTGSGAMLSPTSTMQAETIPGIAYAVRLEVK